MARFNELLSALRLALRVGPTLARKVAGRALIGGGVVYGVACARSAPPPQSTPSSLEAVEGTTVWPAARAEAEASNGVVVLSSPRPGRAARLLVRGFFAAVQHQSAEELSALLSDGATLSSGSGSAPESVAKVWAARFKRFDYGAEGAKLPYREDQLRVFTRQELAQLNGVAGYELMPAPGEILAVVTPRDWPGAGPRPFGRRVEFILGPTDNGLRIVRMFEDFRLP